MNEKVRADKIQALAEHIARQGFTKFVVVGWDAEDHWAATVSHGIEPKRLLDAAAFMTKSAGS